MAFRIVSTGPFVRRDPFDKMAISERSQKTGNDTICYELGPARWCTGHRGTYNVVDERHH